LVFQYTSISKLIFSHSPLSLIAQKYSHMMTNRRPNVVENASFNKLTNKQFLFELVGCDAM
jgi:hypothetical protein